MESLKSVDFNGESTFEIVQVLCFFRAFYEQLGVKFTPWVEDALDRCWAELKCEHEEVLAYFSETLAFTEKIMVSGSVLSRFLSEYLMVRTVASEPFTADSRNVCSGVQNSSRKRRPAGHQRNVPRGTGRGTC